jgi:hypothetical protein
MRWKVQNLTSGASKNFSTIGKKYHPRMGVSLSNADCSSVCFSWMEWNFHFVTYRMIIIPSPEFIRNLFNTENSPDPRKKKIRVYFGQRRGSFLFPTVWSFIQAQRRNVYQHFLELHSKLLSGLCTTNVWMYGP